MVDRRSSELLGSAPDERVLIVNCDDFGMHEAINAVHPGHGTESLRTTDPAGWQIRQGDHAFLTSPEARELLDHGGITVIDYRPLQEAWRR